MTSPPPPNSPGDGDHVDLDRLAELDEALLPDAAAAAVETHLSGCIRCREQQARLRATRALLGSLPAEPMPAHVAERLDAALLGAASGTVVPFDVPRRGWRSRPAAAGAAAVAAVVALIAAVVLGTTLHSSSNGTSADNAAPLGQGVPEQAKAVATVPVQVSGRHYTEATAAKLVAEAAQQATATPSAPGGVQSGAGVLPKVPAAMQTLYTDRDALLRCVTALTAGADPASSVPIAADFGRASNPALHVVDKPAVAILFPGPAGKIDAYIVGPACATAPDNNIYLFERISAPPAG